MAFDSSSELLFSIGADTGDAEGNIQRFRSLLGKDLDDISAEFSDWSSKVFGDMSSVQGVVTAGAATLGAAVLAVGTAAVEAGNKYAEYVSEIAKGTRTTGLSAEQMSGLHYAATETGVSYEALTTALTRFATTTVKASEGSEQQEKAFARLGISQAQVKAGEKDMMPLLMAVSDRFHALGSTVDRAALARELFGRGAEQLLPILAQGSAGIQEFANRCREMGLTVGKSDVDALREYRAAIQSMKAEVEAATIMVGRVALPLMEAFAVALMGILKTIKQDAFRIGGVFSFVGDLKRNTAAAAEEIIKLGKSLKLEGAGEGLRDAVTKTAKLKEDWTGLSDLLSKINARMVGPSVDERTTEEINRLGEEWGKVIKKYDELRAAGELGTEDARAQAAALAEIPKAFGALLTHTITEVNEKNEKIGEDLRRAIGEQQEKTLAQELSNWEAEIAARRERMVREKSDTTENLQALENLEKAGYARIIRAKAEAIEKAGQDIAQRTSAQRERGYAENVAAWNREIDALEQQYLKKEDLTAANQAALDVLRKAGLDKLKSDQDRAFGEEIVRLQEHLKQTISAETTAKEKLWIVYEEDLARYSDVEKKKALATAASAEQRTQIEKEWAALVTGINQKYAVDLQKLLNSQGWQGVFGSYFADTIKRDETLLRQWATSAQQSHLMVKVSLESLKEMGQQTFEQFAQAEGAAIASAIVYSKSIGQAMQSAAAATLESLASQAMAHAIYSVALGLLDLAEGDLAGAAAAFEAAAIFGLVGGGAALLGRAIAPKQANAASGTGTGETSTGAGGAGGGANTGSTVPGSGGASGTHVTVNVWGHVVGTSGVGELCDMINDAVLNQDKTLTATNTKTGVQVVR